MSRFASLRAGARPGGTAGLLAICLLVGLSTQTAGCGASQGQHVRNVAARKLDCKLESLRVTDAEKGVYLIEGCGRAGTFYCTESRSLKTRCIQVTDPDEVAVRGNLSDALASEGAAADKARRHEAEAARPKPAVDIATKQPAAPPSTPLTQPSSESGK